MRTAIAVVSLFALLIVGGCSSTPDTTAPTSTGVTTTAPAPTTSTTVLPTFDEMVASGAKVHEMTPEEVAELAFVLTMSDLLESWDSDDMGRWLVGWDDIGDPDGAVTSLVATGRSYCIDTA